MKSFAELPEAARALWAKSGDEHAGHSLICHMLDVAAVAEAILSRESGRTKAWVAGCFGLPVEHVASWLAALAGAHDFGKGIPGFQAKWPLGMQRDQVLGLPFKPIALTADRHDLASAALLRSMLASVVADPLWVAAIVQALGAHHGYMPRPGEIRDGTPRHEGAAWCEARRALFDAYWQCFSLAREPTKPRLDLPAIAWFAGLTSVADWIGSNQDWFAPGERHPLIAEHYRRARELAEIALDEIGWPAYRPLLEEGGAVDALLGRIVGREGERLSARPLQAEADHLLEQAAGPTLMIVEAPMGEGKTELAFLAHLRLQAINGHRGLYVALPTQATGNAMFDRALTFLQGFAGDIRLDIQLAHGGSMLDERVLHLRDVDASSSEAVASSAWFSQRRRALVSPYGVGTIDQALFSTLNVKHHFVRLWGLANRVVVLDEVHAYDTYTSGLIEALLRWLKAMHCSVVLMSATLPARRRAAFFAAWGSKAVDEIPYPRVLMTRGEGVVGAHVASRTLAPIEVSGLPEDLDSLAASALAKVEDGGCGAIIVNTVQRAQDLYRLLAGQATADVELLLFHARYPADQRSQREKSVLARFSRHGERPGRALLVATQVVEQSLDIDFDFMISDLAPVDLLLQRAGRLHRHARSRPAAHVLPRLGVAGLIADRLPELKETAWGFVYDPYVLYRTWALAAGEPLWQLPDDIDRLVQAVYSQDPLPQEDEAAFLKAFDEAFGKHLADNQQQRQLAINAAVDAAAELQNAYLDKPRGDDDGGGLGFRAVTRLGNDGVTVIPLLAADGGWQLTAEEPPFDPAAPLDDALAQRIFRRQVRLARKDLVQALGAVPSPAGFAEHPLLRHFKVLELKEGIAEFGALRVRLDAALGITYETISSASEDA